MNLQRLLSPLLAIAAAFMSLFVIATILLGHGNHLAMLFRYLLVMGFVAGLFLPRGALMFWLVLCGYTDLLKRLMVVFGSVQYSDLYNVLGIPPVMILGITLAVVGGAMRGRYELSTTHWRLLASSCAVMLVGAGLAAREKGLSLEAIVPAIANDGMYAMLIFVVPVLFKNSDDVLKLVKLLLWGYVPVALYGVFQQVNGFQDFEIAYLKTGLSLEIKQLFADEVRAFSTLNSPTSFSVICAMLCVMSMVLAFTPARDGNRRVVKRGSAILLCVIYLAGIVASTSRSAFLLVIIASLGFFCFRSGRATRWLYAGVGGAFIALVLMADIILANLGTAQSQISNIVGEGKFAAQLSNVGTFSDRLHGFANLVTNPDVYTAFGYGPGRGSDERDPLYSHDMISNVLVTHGLVPLLGMAIFGVVVLTRLHWSVLRLQDPHHRLLAAAFLSLAFSLFALSAVSGSVIGLFPVNAMLWLCFALFMLVDQSGSLQSCGDEAPAQAQTPGPDAAPPGAKPAVVHRFRRSGYFTSDRRA